MKQYDKRLPDAELCVMQVIWQAGEPVTSAYVQAHAAQDWAATSVLTFLSRLADKGFVSCEKQGKSNLYTAQVAQQDYQQSEGASFLQRMYAGSVKNLVVSLSDAGALSAKDLAELRAFLDAQEEG